MSNTIIKGSLSSEGSYLIKADNYPAVNGNQTFSNFTIDGNNRTLEMGMRVSGRHNVTIHDVTFKNINHNGLTVHSGQYAENIQSPAPSTYITGFKLYNSTFTNTSEDCPAGSYSHPLNWNSGAIHIGHLTGALIHDITINENGGFGIKGTDMLAGGGYLKGVKIYNCVINVPKTDPYWVGDASIELWNMYDNCEIYNCTVNNWFSLVAGNKGAGQYSIKVYNNSLILPSGGGQKEAIEVGASDMIMSENYIEGFGSCFGHWNATISNVIFNYTAGDFTVNNNINSNPSIIGIGYRRYTYYTLQSNSPCIDAGVSITGFTTYYIGAAPDIGRYEYGDTALPTGELAGEWHLEENIGTTASDTSGNNNNGTLTNSPQWVTGITGNALQFNGINNYVSVANSASLDIKDALTISVWAYPTRIPVMHDDMVSKDDRIGVRWDGANLRPAFIFKIDDGGSNWRWVISPDAVSLNAWVHIVAVYDKNGGANNMKLYVDGVQKAVGTYTDTIESTTNPLTIGRYSNRYFQGIIDEVKIYNRALTASEVLSEYNSAIPDATAPSTINNLTTSDITTTSITLNWTAVGDDGTTGTASSYDIRYATYSITSSNFGNVIQCNGEPTPRINNSNESFTVTGLTNNTTYYFGIKVADEVSNYSGLSNIANGKTMAVVVPDTTSPSTIVTLSTSNATINSITLTWTSVGDDGTTGTATSYDIRYATYNITTGNFSNTTSALGEPTPLASGNSETFTINSLTTNTTYYFAIKTGDEIPNWAGISNAVTGKTLGDTVAPSQITSLATSNLTTTSITLRWTSIGDDGTTGTAASYDIRYQTYTITTGNWGNVIQCNGEPTPSISGNNESFTITGLSNNTTYYFGIKAGDEIPNWSVISNIAQGKTLAPTGDVTAPSTINTLTTNTLTINSITLAWTSVGDDGTTGTATSYDIRYATYSITSGNWDAVTQLDEGFSPQGSGNSETFTTTNLSANTTYYFAIKVGDEIPNWSSISNVVSAKTLEDTTVPSQITSLATSNLTTTSITLRWTSVGDDGTTGTASSYDIRYATYNITTS